MATEETGYMLYGNSLYCLKISRYLKLINHKHLLEKNKAYFPGKLHFYTYKLYIKNNTYIQTEDVFTAFHIKT